jgi:hypothetical protein
MLVLLVNNNYAEQTFYEYLAKGVIIDFPDSGSPRFMITRPRVWIFLVSFVGYVAFAAVVLIKWQASFGTIAIMANNLVVGIGLMWYNHQQIEDKFVSLTTFIQSFPDADGGYDNIDTVSLTSASSFLMDLALAETPEPSYTGLMRRMQWQRSELHCFGKLMRHIGLTAVIVVLMAVCGLYFFFMDSRLEGSRFNNYVNPCVDVCRRTNASTATCNYCISSCADAFHLGVGLCSEFLSAETCARTDCP